MKFEAAVEQYTTYLLKLSYLYVKDKQVAEDIVQDTFVKIYAQFGNTIEVEKVKSYIVTMTINRCRDYFRSWHYKKVQLSEMLDRQEKDVHNTEQLNMSQSIMQLPVKYREVIILYYYDEQGITDISNILKIPVGTVKTRLQKGRQLLKGIITEEEVKINA